MISFAVLPYVTFNTEEGQECSGILYSNRKGRIGLVILMILSFFAMLTVFLVIFYAFPDYHCEVNKTNFTIGTG